MDSAPFSSTFVDFSRSSMSPDADAEVSINVIEVAGDSAGDNNAQYTHTIAPTPHSPGLLSPTDWHQDRLYHANIDHPRSAPPTPQVGFNTMYRIRQLSRSEENLVLPQNYTLSALNSPSPGAESDYSFTSDQVDGHPPHSPISDTSSTYQPTFNFPTNAGSDCPPSSRSDDQNTSDASQLSPHFTPHRSTVVSQGPPPFSQRQLHTLTDPRTRHRLNNPCPSPSPTRSRVALPPDNTSGPSTTNGPHLFLTDPLTDNFLGLSEDTNPFGYPSATSFNGTPTLCQLTSASSSSSSLHPLLESASSNNDFFDFTMPNVCTMDDNPAVQPGAQSSHNIHNHSFDEHGWIYQNTRDHIQAIEPPLVIKPEQATSTRLDLMAYQAPLTSSANFADNTSNTRFTGRNFSTGQRQPGSINTMSMQIPAEDDASDEMKEQMVDLLADSRDRTEAIQKIHALSIEKHSSAPDELLRKAASRKVGTDEVRNAAHKRKLKSAAFNCVLCPYELTAKDNLKNHYRSHLDYKPCRCLVEKCGMGFGNPSGLKRHMEKKHHFRAPLKRGTARSKSVHRPES